jgi:hypothetical protein
LCRIQMMKEDHQLVEVWAVSPIIPEEENKMALYSVLPIVEGQSLELQFTIKVVVNVENRNNGTIVIKKGWKSYLEFHFDIQDHP